MMVVAMIVYLSFQIPNDLTTFTSSSLPYLAAPLALSFDQNNVSRIRIDRSGMDIYKYLDIK